MNPPIIPGFFPDPSICRVGERYYLVNSSFEYFPGIPLHTSTDLVTWEQVGNVLPTVGTLTVPAGLAGASSGIYAPTIRFHGGRFWVTTTSIGDVRRGHLITHATAPAGPWSEPVFTTGAFGIDPDLFWDDDGTCYLTWHDVLSPGISQAQVNPETGELLTQPKHIWSGTGGHSPEGPHIYYRNGWYYLLVAEGGTGPGHMVTVARSRNVYGPFTANPANPILTHRSTSSPVQATGHGDLVELADGSWAMVHLGTQPRGSFPRWHTNGRETFIVGIDWVGDWPVVDEQRFEIPVVERSFTDRFDTSNLHPRWTSPASNPSSFTQMEADGLLLIAGRDAEGWESANLLATRVTDRQWQAEVSATGDLALTLRIDDAHQAQVQRVGNTIKARAIVGPLSQDLGSESLGDAPVDLAIRAVSTGASPGQRTGPDSVELGYVNSENDFLSLAAIDGRYLSTELAGGFTGRMLGLEALGENAKIHRFTYRPLQD